jgi:hypothetical protein
MWAANAEVEAVLKTLKTSWKNSEVIKALSSKILQTTSPGEFVTTAGFSLINYKPKRSQITSFLNGDHAAGKRADD